MDCTSGLVYDNSFDIIANRRLHAGTRSGDASLRGQMHSRSIAILSLRSSSGINGTRGVLILQVDGRVPGRERSSPSLWQCISLTIDFIVRHFERSGMTLYEEKKADSPEQTEAIAQLKGKLRKTEPVPSAYSAAALRRGSCQSFRRWCVISARTWRAFPRGITFDRNAPQRAS